MKPRELNAENDLMSRMRYISMWLDLYVDIEMYGYKSLLGIVYRSWRESRNGIVDMWG